jgi:hypothetical protein
MVEEFEEASVSLVTLQVKLRLLEERPKGQSERQSEQLVEKFEAVVLRLAAE